MTKKTPTQNLSDPMLIGKFDQKISKLFEEKRRFLPNPQLKKPMIQISPTELNNMRNDINVLRNLLQIEINHKNSLLIQIQKNQNEINANIAYLKKVISLLDSDKIDQIKELKNNLQVLINIQQSNQNSTYVYLKQIDILYQKERNLASESKKILKKLQCGINEEAYHNRDLVKKTWELATFTELNNITDQQRTVIDLNNVSDDSASESESDYNSHSNKLIKLNNNDQIINKIQQLLDEINSQSHLFR